MRAVSETLSGAVSFCVPDGETEAEPPGRHSWVNE